MTTQPSVQDCATAYVVCAHERWVIAMLQRRIALEAGQDENDLPALPPSASFQLPWPAERAYVRRIAFTLAVVPIAGFIVLQTVINTAPAIPIVVLLVGFVVAIVVARSLVNRRKRLVKARLAAMGAAIADALPTANVNIVNMTPAQVDESLIWIHALTDSWRISLVNALNHSPGRVEPPLHGIFDHGWSEKDVLQEITTRLFLRLGRSSADDFDPLKPPMRSSLGS